MNQVKRVFGLCSLVILSACSGGGNSSSPDVPVVDAPLPPSEPLKPLNAEIPITAWVGGENARLRFKYPSELGSLTLYSYTNKSCDVPTPSTCTNLNSKNILSETELTESVVSLSKTSYYELRSPTHYSEKIRMGGHGLPYLIGHQAIYFKGKFWVFGGDAKGLKNDIYSKGSSIWSSDDGKVWQEHESGTSFKGLEGHQVVEFKGQLILTGGEKNRSPSNQVKVSDDGIDWTDAPHSGFPHLSYHQMIVFEDTIYVLGGKKGIYGNYYSDQLLKLNLGKTQGAWEPVNTASSIKPPVHYSAQLAVFKAAGDSKEKLWLVGGETGRKTYLEKVYTFDGTDWEAVDTGNTFGPCKKHTLHVDGESLWVIGCTNKTIRKPAKLFKTSNGTAWDVYDIEKNHWLYGRNSLQIVKQDSSSFAISGADNRKGLLLENEVWRFKKPRDTGEIMLSKALWNDMPVLSPVRATTFKSKLWVAGVDSNQEVRLYNSINGSDWVKQQPPETHINKLEHFIAFDGKLLLFTPKEIHYTEDGLAWQKVSITNGLTDKFGRGQYSLTPLAQNGKERLYLIGGGRPKGVYVNQDMATYGKEVWQSSDGINWIRVTDNAGFNLKNHTSFSLNNQLWVVGGMDEKYKSTDTVWTSSNGKDWSQQNNVVGMEPRRNLSSFVKDGKAYVFGGEDTRRTLKGYLFSTDGSGWGKSSQPKGIGLARQNAAVALLGGFVYIIGGKDMTLQKTNHIWRMNENQEVRRLYKGKIPKKTVATP